MLGGFILFVGFLAFNGGSQLTISNEGDGLLVVKAIMNTVMGGSAGALASVCIHKSLNSFTSPTYYWSLLVTINGGLSGMPKLIEIFAFRRIGINNSKISGGSREQFVGILPSPRSGAPFPKCNP